MTTSPSKTASRTLPKREATLRLIAMPADTNPYGAVFGGWLMCQMDLAANTIAEETSAGRSATVAVDQMSFLQPVAVGDEVSLFAKLIKQGRSSMTIHVEAWKRNRSTNVADKVTEATFVYVAINADGSPRPLAKACA